MKPFSFSSRAVLSVAKPREFGWRGGAAARFLAGIAVAGAVLNAGAQSAALGSADALTFNTARSTTFRSLTGWTPRKSAAKSHSLVLPADFAVTNGIPVPAATYTGTFPGGATTTFTTAGLPSAGSTTSDTLIFNSSGTTGTATGTDNITNAVGANVLTFGNTITLTLNKGTGTSITLGGTNPTVNLNNSGAVTNNLDTVLAANTTFTGTGTGVATFAGVISGPGFGITKTGTGTLLLSGTNTYSGPTEISSGALIIGAAGAIPTASALTVDTGAQLKLSLLNGTTFTHDITDNGTVFGYNGGSSVQTLSGNISGSGGFYQSASGTTILSGVNTYTGTTTVGSGPVTLGSATGLPSATTVNFAQPKTLNLGGFSPTIANLTASSLSSDTGSAIVTNGSLTLSGVNNFSFAPANNTAGTTPTLDLSGLTGFTYNQAAAGKSFAVTVGTNASSTLPTDNATLNLANGTGGNTITATSVNIGPGGGSQVGGVGTLNLGSSNTIDTTMITLGGTRSSGGVMQFNSTATTPTLTLRGLAGGVTPVTTLYVGDPLTVSIANTSVFDTSAGTVNAIVNNVNVFYQGVATAAATGNSGLLKIGSGTFNAGTVTIGSSITGATTSAITATVTQNAGAVLADSVLFNSVPAANTNLTFTSAYNLGTSTTAGLLSAGAIGSGNFATNAASTATLNFNNGTITNYDNTANGFSGQGNANGSTTTNVQNLTLSGTAAAPLSIVLASTGAHNFLAESGQSITEAATAQISGSGGLTTNGSGTVIFNGANTYTGATTVSGGTLQIGSGGITGTLGTGAVTDNATLAFNRTDNAATVANAITGTGTVQQIGSGTTTLTGTDAAATTTVSAGTFALNHGGGGAITGAAVTISGNGAFSGATGTGSNGVLSFSAANQLKGATTAGGSDGTNVTLSRGTLELNGTNQGSTTNSGVTRTGGNAGVTETSFGAGTLSVSGGNSYLDFGAGNMGGVFTFSGYDFGSTGNLYIENYNDGNFNGSLHPAAGGGIDQLFFGNGQYGAQELLNVFFVNPIGQGGATYTGIYEASLLSTGEVVAPEPSEWVSLLMGALGVAGLSLKARRRRAVVVMEAAI